MCIRIVFGKIFHENGIVQCITNINQSKSTVKQCNDNKEIGFKDKLVIR